MIQRSLQALVEFHQGKATGAVRLEHHWSRPKD